MLVKGLLSLTPITVLSLAGPGLYLSNFNKGGQLSARPEGPTLETRRAESGGGVLGEGAASPLPTS